MASQSQYPDINDDNLAGLLRVATAAADAQSALGKRKRDEDSFIDHQLRIDSAEAFNSHQSNTQTPAPVPTLQNAAAVMFREPSEKSRKYSRPPTAKVYHNLGLAAEVYVKLQAAAKAFMLDPAHPERQSVVGYKQQNSNETSRLQLYRCVEEFMEKEHNNGMTNGEVYFGPNTLVDGAGAPPRNTFWPQDRKDIIQRCIHLFRKMVTNERQRIYAAESRKQGTKKKPEDPDAAYNYAEADTGREVRGKTSTSRLSAGHDESPPTPPRSSEGSLTLHVNILSKDATGTQRRIIPRLSIPADAVQTLQALYGTIQERFDLAPYRRQDANGDATILPDVKIWLEIGMYVPRNDTDWATMLEDCRHIEWMDGELKIIMEL